MKNIDTNKIYIFDHIINQEHQRFLSNIISMHGWRYNHTGNEKHKEYEPLEEFKSLSEDRYGLKIQDAHWSFQFKKLKYVKGETEPLGVYALWLKIFNTIKEEHDINLTLINSYVNGITSDRFGFSHIDSPNFNYWTILYYANPIWKVDWAGETVFFNSEKTDIIQSVFPRPGRFIFFNSTIPHVARPITSFFRGLRITYAFKTVITENKKETDKDATEYIKDW